MKRNILLKAAAAWLVLCAVLWPAWDAFPGMVNIPISMFHQPKPELSFEACTEDATNLTTYTFANHDTGTAAGNRHTIVGIIGNDGSGEFAVDSVTIEGDSATEVAEGGGGSGINRTATLYIMANPVGTAEDIVVTFSEAVNGAAICTWAAYALKSATAVDTAQANTGDGTTQTLDLDTQAHGIVAGICGGTNSANPFVWTGLTEREDTAGTDTDWSAADVTEDGTGAAPLSVTCDGNGTADQAGSAASFR